MMGLRGEAARREERIKEDCVKGLRMEACMVPPRPADHMPSKITGLFFHFPSFAPMHGAALFISMEPTSGAAYRMDLWL